MDHLFSQLGSLLFAFVLFAVSLWFVFRKSILFKMTLIWMIDLLLVISNTVISLHYEESYSFLFAMIVNGAMTLVFLLMFKNMLKKPLHSLVDTMNTFSKGDFSKRTIDLEANKNNEIGELNRGIEELRKSFSHTVKTFSQNATAIHSVCSALNTSSRTLAAATNDNASSLEEISASMEEMVSNISANVENTQKTETLAKKANQSVSVGNQSAVEALNLMNEISEKIQIVNEISFETNVLALNASVEASRAGEQGRGFSVVASEIRRLAEHSKQASNEIKEMTARGSSKSEEAMGQLNESLPLMYQTSINIQEINVASMEQNSGADQINSAVQSMNKVTQQNAAIADEMLQSSDEILKTANILLNLAKKFKY